MLLGCGCPKRCQFCKRNELPFIDRSVFFLYCNTYANSLSPCCLFSAYSGVGLVERNTTVGKRAQTYATSVIQACRISCICRTLPCST